MNKLARYFLLAAVMVLSRLAKLLKVRLSRQGLLPHRLLPPLIKFIQGRFVQRFPEDFAMVSCGLLHICKELQDLKHATPRNF
jgi:hypothetical protein